MKKTLSVIIILSLLAAQAAYAQDGVCLRVPLADYFLTRKSVSSRTNNLLLKSLNAVNFERSPRIAIISFAAEGGWILSRIMPQYLCGGYINIFEKCTSLVTSTLLSLRAKFMTSPFFIPEGTLFTSWPSPIKYSTTSKPIFSSIKNFISRTVRNECSILFALNHLSSKMEGSLNMGFCKRGVISNNLLSGFSGFKEFEYQIYHYARSFKAGLAMADIRVSSNIIFDSHFCPLSFIYYIMRPQTCQDFPIAASSLAQVAYAGDGVCLRVPMGMVDQRILEAKKRLSNGGEPSEEAIRIARKYMKEWNSISIKIFEEEEELSAGAWFQRIILTGTDGVEKMADIESEQTLDVFRAIYKINPDWAAAILISSALGGHETVEYIFKMDYDKPYLANAIDRTIQLFKNNASVKCINKTFKIQYSTHFFLLAYLIMNREAQGILLSNLNDESIAFITLLNILYLRNEILKERPGAIKFIIKDCVLRDKIPTLVLICKELLRSEPKEQVLGAIRDELIWMMRNKIDGYEEIIRELEMDRLSIEEFSDRLDKITSWEYKENEEGKLLYKDDRNFLDGLLLNHIIFGDQEQMGMDEILAQEHYAESIKLVCQLITLLKAHERSSEVFKNEENILIYARGILLKSREAKRISLADNIINNSLFRTHAIDVANAYCLYFEQELERLKPIMEYFELRNKVLSKILADKLEAGKPSRTIEAAN